MKQLMVTRDVAAPVARVFATLADVNQFAKVQPQIVGVEFLSEQRSGVGTRFRETRVMGGRKASTVLEVTEFEPDHRIRLVSDTGGCVWDTVFEVAGTAERTHVEMCMGARPHTLLARLTMPLMMPMVRKAVAADLDRIKTYCETPVGS